MTEADVIRRTREFVVDNFMYMRKSKELRDDDSLLRTGLISSLGMMELVEWVQDTFALTIDPVEITEQNFDTVQNIARYVATKSSGSTS